MCHEIYPHDKIGIEVHEDKWVSDQSFKIFVDNDWVASFSDYAEAIKYAKYIRENNSEKYKDITISVYNDGVYPHSRGAEKERKEWIL